MMRGPDGPVILPIHQEEREPPMRLRPKLEAAPAIVMSVEAHSLLALF